MRRNLSLVFLGLVLILFGVAWGGSRVGLLPGEIFFDGWWSLILIVAAVYGIIEHGPRSANVILLLVGVVFLLSGLGFIDWDRFKVLFWPAVVIVIGLMVIVSVFKKKPLPGAERAADANVYASFGSERFACEGRPYHGGRVETFFGSAELDLGDAVIERDISVNASAVFGTVKIDFPRHVRVEVVNRSIFGNVRDMVPDREVVNAPTVYVRCRAFCGGITLE